MLGREGYGAIQPEAEWECVTLEWCYANAGRPCCLPIFRLRCLQAPPDILLAAAYASIPVIFGTYAGASLPLTGSPAYSGCGV